MENREYIAIKFQEGPILEVGSNGCQVEDVIGVLIDRLRELNVPPHNIRETSLAITSLEEAEHWLWRRTRNRLLAGTEGTGNP